MGLKNIRCPECGGKNISFFYAVNYTHIYCQNFKRENQCPSVGKYCFKTYHYLDEKYPEVIQKDKWIFNGIKEESIKYE